MTALGPAAQRSHGPPPAAWLGAQRIDLDECGSTNDEAARLARAGARHGTVVIARSQRAGRGRDGRVWVSPPGLGLYLSAVVRPPLPLGQVPPMTLAIGVAVCDAVRAFGAAAALKWPNDVLVAGRKLSGVLVEAQSQGSRLEAVIVGIGVNLGGELPPGLGGELPPGLGGELSPGLGGEPPPGLAAITLAQAAGAPPDREAFIACLLRNVEHWIDRYIASGLPAIVPAWQDRMAPGLAARATVDGAPVTGELAGLDGDGALLLRDGAGAVHRVRSGDVEVIRPTPAAEPVAPAC